MDVNKRLKEMVAINVSNSSDSINDFISQVDPVVWETINILTSGSRSASDTQTHPDPTHIKTRAFILSQMMYCMDNRASMPFQLIISDTARSTVMEGPLN